MRLGYISQNTPRDVPPARLAAELEARGFGSLWVGEHPQIPVAARDSPLAPMLGPLKRKYDPLIVLAVAADTNHIGPSFNLELFDDRGEDYNLHLFRYDPAERTLTLMEEMITRFAMKGLDVSKEREQLNALRHGTTAWAPGASVACTIVIGLWVEPEMISADSELAREHPERYRDLVVRIGGYTDYFTRLSPDMQDEVILRTEYV